MFCAVFLLKFQSKSLSSSVIWSDVDLQVATKDPGSIKAISVKVGDRVEKGQVIADLDQSQIEDKLKQLENLKC